MHAENISGKTHKNLGISIISREEKWVTLGSNGRDARFPLLRFAVRLLSSTSNTLRIKRKKIVLKSNRGELCSVSNDFFSVLISLMSIGWNSSTRGTLSHVFSPLICLLTLTGWCYYYPRPQLKHWGSERFSNQIAQLVGFAVGFQSLVWLLELPRVIAGSSSHSRGQLNPQRLL